MTSSSINTFFSQKAVKQIKLHLSVDKSGMEIYGWLIGLNVNKRVYILVSIPCFNYDTQSIFNARPTTQEVSILSSSLPEGLGIVGIYHSHPGEVFHSHIDNETILNFGGMYQHFTSLVTNRQGKMKVYRIINFEEKKISRVGFDVKNLRPPQQFHFQIELSGIALIDKEYPLPSLSRTVREQVERIFSGGKIETNKGIIHPGLKVTQIKKKKINIQRKIPFIWQDQNAIEKIKVKYNLSADIPVYYPSSKIITEKMIDSLRISLTDLLLKKVSFGEIKDGKLRPGKALYFKYLGIEFFTAFGTQKQQNKNSINFISGMIAKASLLNQGGYKTEAKKILKAAISLFDYIKNEKEKQRIEKLLAEW